ncbi:MAG: hypothetical protein ACYDA8_12300 [Deferrisomatales bacterium]
MGGRRSPWDWAVVILVATLVVGMALTLWAGWTGRVRSVHGIQGLGPRAAAYGVG